jgi:hypothetical protein
MRGALIGVLCTQLCACSFFLPSAKKAPPGERLDCGWRERSMVIDGIFAAGFVGAGTVITIRDANSNSEFKGLATLVAGIPAIVIGLVFTVSTLYGYSSLDDCEEHNSKLLPLPVAPAD